MTNHAIDPYTNDILTSAGDEGIRISDIPSDLVVDIRGCEVVVATNL